MENRNKKFLVLALPLFRTKMNYHIEKLFNVLVSIKTFHSPGGAGARYLNNWLNPIFAFSTFKNTIPALDRVLYSTGNAGASI